MSAFGFAHDGILHVHAGLTGSAWNVDTGVRLSAVVAPEYARPARLADGRWLHAYGQILWLHAATGELLAARTQAQDGAWATWTPQGRWDASPGGTELIATSDALAPCTGRGIRHPDLWAQALAGAQLPAPPRSAP